MTAITVGSTLVSSATSGTASSLILTLGAAATKGDLIIVPVMTSGSFQFSTCTDSKGNLYNFTSLDSSNPIIAYYACLVSNALSISDTITITMTGSQASIAATVLQLTNASINNSYASGYSDENTASAATSVSAALNSLTTTHIDDILALAIIGTSGATLAATDFTSGSINQSYTKMGSVVSSGGTTNAGIQICYKLISAASPMPAQNPTFTLNASRAWKTRMIMFSGLMSRGSIGIHLAPFSAGSISTLTQAPMRSFVQQAGLRAKSINDGAPQTVMSPATPKVGQQVSDGTFSSE